MAQAVTHHLVSRRSIVVEVRAQFEVSHVRNMVEEVALGQIPSPP
jgi:hypothetical protein